MTLSSTRAAEQAPAHGRGTAYQAANWHIVRAGLLMAGSGVPKDAPEMRALAAALRAVNQAGGIEEAKTFRPVPETLSRPESQKEVERVFPTVGGSGATRPGKVA
ncbi:MAG TPA: hypothetical protein VF950_08730 [Planctomycetota bacterium]